MRPALLVCLLSLCAVALGSNQCVSFPTPTGNDFLQVQLESPTPDVICYYTLFAPYNTTDSLTYANPVIVLQLRQSSVEFCCSNSNNVDHALRGSYYPYTLIPNGHFTPNVSRLVQITLPFTAYLEVKNEDDYNFTLPTKQPTTITVSNTSFDASCGVKQPYLTIFGAAGGGDLADIPFESSINVSALDKSFELTISPVSQDCTAPIKISVSATTFSAPPQTCLTPLAYSNTSCPGLPCSDENAFVCFPGLQGILNVFAAEYSNISVTVTPTAVYPIQCFANGKQVATEGLESGWFTALAGTTTAIECTTVGAIQYQPPFPTWQITATQVPFTPTTK